MKTTEFLKQLKEINQGLDIVPNPNRAGLSNVKLNGIDVCPVPSDEIKDEPDNNYRYEFPNGMSARHNSIADVIQKVKNEIAFLETEEGKNLDV